MKPEHKNAVKDKRKESKREKSEKNKHTAKIEKIRRVVGGSNR